MLGVCCWWPGLVLVAGVGGLIVVGLTVVAGVGLVIVPGSGGIVLVAGVGGLDAVAGEEGCTGIVAAGSGRGVDSRSLAVDLAGGC